MNYAFVSSLWVPLEICITPTAIDNNFPYQGIVKRNKLNQLLPVVHQRP